MGSKHNKKRFFCVKYIIKPDKKFDEFVELSKKKIGPGKMQEYEAIQTSSVNQPGPPREFFGRAPCPIWLPAP